jgi:hypothetical protein
VVIGITSIVGMTSLIAASTLAARHDPLARTEHDLHRKISGVSLSSGADFATLMRRPNLTVADAKAIEKLAPSIETVDVWLGEGGQSQERVYYRGERTRSWRSSAPPRSSATSTSCRSSTDASSPRRGRTRRRVAVLGYNPYERCSRSRASTRSARRSASAPSSTRSSASCKKRRRSLATRTTSSSSRRRPIRILRGHHQQRGRRQHVATIVVVPYKDIPRDKALAEVEEIMRIRHGLKLDEENDFDIATQDAILKIWDRISRAFLVLWSSRRLR